MRRIATLLYSHYFPPSVGGVEVYASMLADRLAASPEIDLTVATETAASGDVVDSARDFRLYRRLSMVKLAALASRADVVLMMGLQPQLATVARLRGIPVVWVHLNHDTACPKTMGYRWQDDAVCSYQPLQCWSCLRVDRSPGQAIRNIAALHVRRALFNGVHHVSPADIVRSRLLRPLGRVIPTACNLDLFRPDVDVPRDLERVSFVARLIPEKGAHVFISALARARREGAPDLRAVICGEGPERGRLEALARVEGVHEHVTFRGVVQRADLPREIAASLAVVNPQLWDWTLGISAMEVLACSRPLISTRPADPGEIPNDVALLFERGDTAAFARALVRVRTDERERSRLEERGLAFARVSHNIDLAAARYLDLIKEVTA